MSIGHKATIRAAKTMAATGLDLFTQPDLIAAAKEDFKKQTKGQAYKSLNERPKPPGEELRPDGRHHYECCIHGAVEHFDIVDEPHASASLPGWSGGQIFSSTWPRVGPGTVVPVRPGFKAAKTAMTRGTL